MERQVTIVRVIDIIRAIPPGGDEQPAGVITHANDLGEVLKS